MRVSKPPDERRAELVAAARQLFDERGVAKTRVSDIVRQVGVAQGVFYYYFQSKAQMVDEVVRQVSDEAARDAEAIMQNPATDFYGKLAGMIELVIDVVDKFVADEALCLPPVEQETEQAGGLRAQVLLPLIEQVTELVVQGAAQGLVTARYPRETVQVLRDGLFGLARVQVPTRLLIYSVVEQSLGLPTGRLIELLPGKETCS